MTKLNYPRKAKFNIKSNSCSMPNQQNVGQKLIVISINGEKVKFQQPFLTQSKFRTEVGFNLINIILYKILHLTMYLKLSFLRLGARQRCLFFLHLSNIAAGGSSQRTSPRKEKNRSQLLRVEISSHLQIIQYTVWKI